MFAFARLALHGYTDMALSSSAGGMRSFNLGQAGLRGVLHAGKREWPAFRDWFAHNLAPALDAWMGNVEVVYAGQEKLDPSSKYVFGYAPHGLFPIGEPFRPTLSNAAEVFTQEFHSLE